MGSKCTFFFSALLGKYTTTDWRILGIFNHPLMGLIIRKVNKSNLSCQTSQKSNCSFQDQYLGAYPDNMNYSFIFTTKFDLELVIASKWISLERCIQVEIVLSTSNLDISWNRMYSVKWSPSFYTGVMHIFSASFSCCIDSSSGLTLIVVQVSQERCPV